MNQQSSSNSFQALLQSGNILELRNQFLLKTCQSHYEKNPIKFVRGWQQYMYDDVGQEFLDCVNNVALVGHCHSTVVRAGQRQMQTLIVSDKCSPVEPTEFSKKLLTTLPESFDVCCLVNSGSEANDLALQLARAYTKHEDILVIDNAFHGSVGITPEINSANFGKFPQGIVESYVHVLPLPNLYNGKHQDGLDGVSKYIRDAENIISQVITSGRQIAGFISEPIFTTSGVIFPPKNYLKYIYECVRKVGGLCICDETQTSMGRIGYNFWGFQTQHVVPDIITIGKVLGNGYPMAAIITRSEIITCLPYICQKLPPNPVSNMIGLAVLEVVEEEKLMENSFSVGNILLDGLKRIMVKHQHVGDVRGSGLLVGIEIVESKGSRKPSPGIVEEIIYRLKEEFVLVRCCGPHQNVIFLSPPLCFNFENAFTFLHVLDKVLSGLEIQTFGGYNGNILGLQTVSLDVITASNSSIHHDSNDEPVNKRWCDLADID